MILATRGGNAELRDLTGISVPTYMEFMGLATSSGVPVTTNTALGLPTVGAAVRLIAETVAALELEVCSGRGADRERQTDSVAWRLLHDVPNLDQSPFDFISDVAASIETYGNAYVRKLKARRGPVLGLSLIAPQLVTVKRDEGNRKVFDIGVGGERERLTDAQLIHIRGFTPGGGDVGLSPIAQHREALGSALALQQFQGKFFKNDATPGLYMSVPERINAEQADNMRAMWKSKHGGLDNRDIAIIGNGATLGTLGIPLRDAQFIEGHAQSAELAARIYLGPAASLLGADNNVKTEEESLRFLNFCLLPRLRRIEAGFGSDYDLFPEDAELYAEFRIDEMLRADAATRAEVMHKQLQTGVLLVDEARAELGRPPLPDGMGQIPQIVPVGGSPFGVPTPDGDGQTAEE